MYSTDDVCDLANFAGLDPSTLSWMTKEPPLSIPAERAQRYPYDLLSDDEWSVVSPHWPTANQGRTSPRDIVNALLMIASTGCGWGNVSAYASAEAARQQFRRRAKSGVLAVLPELLRGQIGEARLGQFVRVAELANRH